VGTSGGGPSGPWYVDRGRSIARTVTAASVTGLSRLRRVWGSFWFIPAVLCAGAAVLAEVLVTSAEAGYRLNLGPFSPLYYRIGPSGSRELLGAIAGSMLTVASTTFSITIAVLALTSSTYGARLVRNFMTDRVNQVVLGVFVATFLYSLLVLRSIRTTETSDGTETREFVPHLAVNVGVLLALVSIGFLVWFIHHISDSIQVSTLSARVRGELRWTVDRLYPEDLGADVVDVPDDGPDLPAPAGGAGALAARDGYVIEVRQDSLMRLASDHDVIVRLLVRPGTFCIAGMKLALVSPEHRADRGVLRGVEAAIVLADARNPRQDVEFATQQLVELAVRALSPGTNDPFTAVNALDDLSAGLALLARRPTPSARRYDKVGKLRVVAPAVPSVDLVNLVFDAMRVYALDHPAVLHSAVDLADRISSAGDRRLGQALAVQLDLLLAAYARSDPQHYDLARLRDRVDSVRRRAGTPAAAETNPTPRTPVSAGPADAPTPS
jgi:uncharacterized membrane protein